MADRIISKLKNYEAKHNKKAPAICFCLTPFNCEKLAEILSSNEVKAAALHAKTGAARSKAIIEQFESRETQVLCATKSKSYRTHKYRAYRNRHNFDRKLKTLPFECLSA